MGSLPVAWLPFLLDQFWADLMVTDQRPGRRHVRTWERQTRSPSTDRRGCADLRRDNRHALLQASLPVERIRGESGNKPAVPSAPLTRVVPYHPQARLRGSGGSGRMLRTHQIYANFWTSSISGASWGPERRECRLSYARNPSECSAGFGHHPAPSILSQRTGSTVGGAG